MVDVENGNCSNGFHINEDGEMTLYKKDAVSVVSFKIVYSKDDLNSNKSGQFKPDMAHQVFGESESIFGYRSLSINLCYHHNSSNCYVNIQKSGKIKNSDLYQPDDIMKCLEPWLPENFTTRKDEFEKLLENEKHDLMYGSVLAEFKDKQECKLFSDQGVYANYKITLCDITDPNFKDFHRRFETFIVWFIDAANFIDLEDERWMIFYAYEEVQHPQTKKTYRSPVGFCTVYKFFAYPNNVRARISQFFVLPSHQRRGIGSKLYETIVRKIKEMPEVIDITVEEPTVTFQKIRDFDDCLTIYKALEDANVNIGSSSSKKIFEHMRKHKICKRQCQRIYDILGCYVARKSSGEEYKAYINNIKNRIAADIERETRGSKRICNLERAGIIAEPIDKDALIESEFKRYIDDLEPSIKYLQQHLATSN